MDFSTDIKFSSDLIENQKTTITYSGYLFKNNSDSVKIVYGFGDSWMYTEEKNMEKTENGFVVTIRMLNFSKFNFCFKNSNNEWDNNYNSNYIAPISEFKTEEAFIINENVIENILENLFKYDISEFVDKVENNNIEKNEVPVENVSIDTFEVHLEKDEAIDITDTDMNVVESSSLNEDLEKEFADLYSKDSEPENLENFKECDDTEDVNEDINNEVSTSTEGEDSDSKVDSLISDLISDLYEHSKSNSVVDVENAINPFLNIEENKEASLIEELNKNGNDESDEIEVKSVLITEEHKAKVEEQTETALVVSPRSLTKFYTFKKKFKLAVYKFFTAIPKILSSSFNEEDDN